MKLDVECLDNIIFTKSKSSIHRLEDVVNYTNAVAFYFGNSNHHTEEIMSLLNNSKRYKLLNDMYIIPYE